jgi:hypothetical protein
LSVVRAGTSGFLEPASSVAGGAESGFSEFALSAARGGERGAKIVLSRSNIAVGSERSAIRS